MAIAVKKFNLLTKAAKLLPPIDRMNLSAALATTRIIKSRYVDLAAAPGAKNLLWNRGWAGLGDVLDIYNGFALTRTKIRLKDGGFILDFQDGSALRFGADVPDFIFSGEIPVWQKPTEKYRVLNTALGGINRFLENNPDHSDARIMKARILRALGKHDEAQSLLEGIHRKAALAIEGRAILSDLILFDAVGLSSKGRMRDAYNACSRALDIFPGNDRAKDKIVEIAARSPEIDLAIRSWLRIAELGRVNEAIAGLSRLADREEEHRAKALDALRSLYVNVAGDAAFGEDHLSAVFFYREALSLRPTPDIEKALALSLYKAGRYEEAFSVFCNLIDKFPLPLECILILADLHIALERDPREALRLFNKVIRKEPHNKDAVFGKAVALMRIGALSDAQELLEGVKDHKPEARDAFEVCGKLLALLDEGNGLRPEQISHLPLSQLRMLSRSLKKKGFMSAVEVCCRRILEIEPSDTGAMLIIARAFAREGSMVRAEEILRSILALEPANRLALSDMVNLFKHAGRLEEANAVLEAELSNNPDQRVFHTAFLFYRDIGDASRMFSTLEKALEFDPDDNFLRLKLIKLLKKERTDESLTKALALCEHGISHAPDLHNYLKEKASILLIKKDDRGQKDYHGALQTLLELHMKIVNTQNRGKESRGKLIWAELRLAETYMDLGEVEPCRWWFTMVEPDIPFDERAVEVAGNIRAWLKRKGETSTTG